MIDFEYKKYLLLAYLKSVGARFNEKKLYPFLSDLVFHYRNLISIRDKKEKARNDFPKELSRLDFENFKLEYERMVGDAACLEVISNILDFAIPQIQQQLVEGRDIYDYVDQDLKIEPIGIMPIDLQEGYLFLYAEKQRKTRVYSYGITLFERQDEAFRGIKTEYLQDFKPSITQTFEAFKLQLIKTNKALPNPATWLVSSGLAIPVEETLLPVAKRALIRYLAANERQG